MTLMTAPLGQKRLELLRELAPRASVVAMLVNPISPDTIPEIRDVQLAAKAIGLELKMFNASTPSELNDVRMRFLSVPIRSFKYGARN